MQHVPFEGLGSIETWAGLRGHTISVTRFHAADPLPPIDSFDWLVVLGGPMNIYEDIKYPWLKNEKRFIENAIENGQCVLGICLGAQLIADVLGGKIYRNVHREIGWFPIYRTQAAYRSVLSSFLPSAIEAFHWHGDTFDLPPGAIHLARSEACENQAFVYEERAVGLQFHLETTRISAEDMIKHCRDDIIDGTFVQTPEQLLSQKAAFNKINQSMDSLLDTLFNIRV